MCVCVCVDSRAGRRGGGGFIMAVNNAAGEAQHLHSGHPAADTEAQRTSWGTGRFHDQARLAQQRSPCAIYWLAHVLRSVHHVPSPCCRISRLLRINGGLSGFEYASAPPTQPHSQLHAWSQRKVLSEPVREQRDVSKGKVASVRPSHCLLPQRSPQIRSIE